VRPLWIVFCLLVLTAQQASAGFLFGRHSHCAPPPCEVFLPVCQQPMLITWEVCAQVVISPCVCTAEVTTSPKGFAGYGLDLPPTGHWATFGPMTGGGPTFQPISGSYGGLIGGFPFFGGRGNPLQPTRPTQPPTGDGGTQPPTGLFAPPSFAGPPFTGPTQPTTSIGPVTPTTTTVTTVTVVPEAASWLQILIGAVSGLGFRRHLYALAVA
jgi:hypothetical protein